MVKILRGKVHGKIIELDEDPGVAEGEQVEIQLEVVTKDSRTPGGGLLRTEGALADDSEWDAIVEKIYQERKLERKSQVPDLGEP